ncbi:unnamed protein product, partial [Ixodes pacificus]
LVWIFVRVVAADSSLTTRKSSDSSASCSFSLCHQRDSRALFTPLFRNSDSVVFFASPWNYPRTLELLRSIALRNRVTQPTRSCVTLFSCLSVQPGRCHRRARDLLSHVQTATKEISSPFASVGDFRCLRWPLHSQSKGDRTKLTRRGLA